ncbi:SpoIID/LytB domain-containing protein [Anaeromicropila populeti]|uniref:Stage II sporulation protein n=1 Tax=Anaeromicropila populeti TaxID=37658 RepID=A0A1I6KSA1_9FIRM|nr:SpoIID/LytB domain-containing protein [Anaeromicropila populeti]SFR93800.1 Stage II sporulation protein [Anaeromicropila populeti]
MSRIFVYPAQMTTTSKGMLRVDCTSALGNRPVEGAVVRIAYSDEPNVILEEVTTDSIGRTVEIELSAPDIEYSLQPSEVRPYTTYNVSVQAVGFEEFSVKNVEILPDQLAIQNANLIPFLDEEQQPTAEMFVIGPHTLYGEYPPKIAEDEIKPLKESGEIVLSSVVIPEYIIVHNGPPTDPAAPNYYVKYKDYIKNVASSEIYATWPEASIMANILAIQSFALNRVFTEWYKNKGYNFTITSSTAYDQKFMPGRNIFSSISSAVDAIFVNYLSRPNVTQPILTQYCDGKRTTCPGWMT